jgi:hypothetical protein
MLQTVNDFDHIFFRDDTIFSWLKGVPWIRDGPKGAIESAEYRANYQ